MATRVILIRHGESVVNLVGLATDSRTNSPLTDLGREQARAGAAAVIGEGIVHVYASPVQRARETGEIAAAALGVPVTVREGLEEIRVGATHEGETAPASMVRGVLDFRMWFIEEDFDHGYPADGENGTEVVERCATALRQIVADHDGDTVLVVSHGATLGFVVSALCPNVRPTQLFTRQAQHCTPIELVHDDGAWTCVHWQGEAPQDMAPVDLDVALEEVSLLVERTWGAPVPREIRVRDDDAESVA
jgi:broad specificity phosphatase PhoE